MIEVPERSWDDASRNAHRPRPAAFRILSVDIPDGCPLLLEDGEPVYRVDRLAAWFIAQSPEMDERLRLHACDDDRDWFLRSGMEILCHLWAPHRIIR